MKMLDTFASVGAESFDVTRTTLDEQKISFRRDQRLDQLRRTMADQLAGAERLHNVIVRPRGEGVTFIQLDDLDAAAIERVKPAAFLSLQTSPGNNQAWLALRALPDLDVARRLRRGAEADDTASGATRVAGSLNFKPKYAPNFPRVEITHAAPGRFATPGQLEALHLVAEAGKPKPPPVRVSSAPRGKTWPRYDLCVQQGAPPKRGSDEPDISRADFTWCMTAIDWAWSIEETAGELMQRSTKAQENGERYALLTAQNAAAAPGAMVRAYMDLHLKNPDLQAKVERWAAETGRSADELAEDAIAGYLQGLAELRATLDSRYDELESGRVKPIDGEEAFAHLRAKSDARRHGGA